MELQLEKSWKLALKNELEKEYFQNIIAFINTEKAKGKIIFPDYKNIFYAFDCTPIQNIKVVILGQDPYHGFGQAHGLCFSVPKGVSSPPSLVNIFKELKTDLGFDIAKHGCLDAWAKHGVFLLNTSLTVEQGLPMSHSKIGWEQFTNEVIKIISSQLSNIVFILWGKFAQGKKQFIDTQKHLVIASAHPSPLSAHNGFWNSKPFSKTNEFLLSYGKEIINWEIK